MSVEFTELLKFMPTTLGFILLGLVLVLIAKILKGLSTSYDIAEELTQKDNPAFGLSLAGYYAGVFAIIAGAIRHDGKSFQYLTPEEFLVDAGWTFAYGLGGIILLNVARKVVDKLILPGFDVTKEIIVDRNSGAGAVEFGSYFASGLIIAGSITGDLPEDIDEILGREVHAWEEPLMAIVFFAIAQVILIVYTRFYEATASFDVLDEIERDNVPVGVALGGNLIAIALVMLRAIGGEFHGWEESLILFLVDAVFGFFVFFALRVMVDRIFLPGSRLEEEIRRDRNINAAYIECVMLIGGAALIFYAA